MLSLPASQLGPIFSVANKCVLRVLASDHIISPPSSYRHRKNFESPPLNRSVIFSTQIVEEMLSALNSVPNSAYRPRELNPSSPLLLDETSIGTFNLSSPPQTSDEDSWIDWDFPEIISLQGWDISCTPMTANASNRTTSAKTEEGAFTISKNQFQRCRKPGKTVEGALLSNQFSDTVKHNSSSPEIPVNSLICEGTIESSC